MSKAVCDPFSSQETPTDHPRLHQSLGLAFLLEWDKAKMLLLWTLKPYELVYAALENKVSVKPYIGISHRGTLVGVHPTIP